MTAVQHNKSQRDEYISRINRVLDYIDRHLDHPLSLETLAREANFSPFHFHRIFSALMGETLNQFIQRVRLEKAAMQLIHDPAKSITAIAMDHGYASPAAFARAFKDAFNMSASQYRTENLNAHRKIGKAKSNRRQAVGKHRKDKYPVTFYIDPVTRNPKWRMTTMGNRTVAVEVKTLPAITVAYIRHIGPFQGDAKLFETLFQELCRWAGPRGLIQPPQTQFLSVYHDSPDITEDDKLRLSVCLSVEGDTPVSGKIGKMKVPGGEFAVMRVEIRESAEYQAAWDTMMGDWLPESGYQPDDRPSYELYMNDPETHPEKLHIVDLCLPVKPL